MSDHLQLPTFSFLYLAPIAWEASSITLKLYFFESALILS
jgi:hypothetical protein